MIDGTSMMIDLLQRDDLRLIGLVYASGKRTETLWCSPREEPPARYDHEQPAAMILLMRDGISTFLDPKWGRKRWFTRYVEQLTKEIHSHVDRRHVST